MAQKAGEPKQLVLEMVSWDKAWKPCPGCKDDAKKRSACWRRCGAGGWHVVRLRKV